MSIFGDAIYFCGGGGGGKSVDTGLGWCANNAWLANQSGPISTLTKPVSSTRLRGAMIDTGLGWAADSEYLINTADLTLATIATSLYGTRTYKKFANGYAIAVCVSNGWEMCGPLVISTVSEYVTYVVSGSISGTITATGTVNFMDKTWYYAAGYWLPGFSVTSITNRNILLYDAESPADIETMVQNVLIAAGVGEPEGTYNYDKSTNGYSVVCNCKWITSYGGDVYFSPVLISSVEANTAYTRNSTAISGTTTHTYEGMTFYMRKGTNDTLSGTETITSYVPLIDLTGDTYTDDTIFTTIMSAANGAVLPTS